MTRPEKIAFLEANGWTNKFNGIWWTREGSGNVRMAEALEMTASNPVFDDTSTQGMQHRTEQLLAGLGERNVEQWAGPTTIISAKDYFDADALDFRDPLASSPKKPWETSEYWERLGA